MIPGLKEANKIFKQVLGREATDDDFKLSNVLSSPFSKERMEQATAKVNAIKQDLRRSS